MSADLSAPETVFAVPLGDSEGWGVGQIAHRSGDASRPFYVAVFDGVHDEDGAAEVDIDVALSEPVVLLALTMDALLYHKKWPVLDRRHVVVDRSGLPAYREDGPDGEDFVVDHSGKHRQRADAKVVERLRYLTVVAPIRVQKAFRALHGRGEWDPVYDELKPPEPDLTTEAVIGRG